MLTFTLEHMQINALTCCTEHLLMRMLAGWPHEGIETECGDVMVACRCPEDHTWH